MSDAPAYLLNEGHSAYQGIVAEWPGFRLIVCPSYKQAGTGFYRVQRFDGRFGSRSWQWYPVRGATGSNLALLLAKASGSIPGLASAVQGLPDDPLAAAPSVFRLDQAAQAEHRSLFPE